MEKTWFYLYQITNLLDGKIYVGVHKTKNLDDGYMGSGKIIRHAIDKYGIKNFKKDILSFFDNQEDMFKEESEIVNKDFILRDDVYNLTEGGFGGNRLTKEQSAKIGKDNLFYQRGLFSPANKNCRDDYYRSDKFKQDQLKASERAASEVSNRKRKQAMKEKDHQKGETNSQFGTMWITDGSSNKKIRKDEEIPFGWKKGRKIK